MIKHWTLTANARTLGAFVCAKLEQSIVRYTRLSHPEVQQWATRVVCGRLAGESSSALKQAVHRRRGGAAARQHHQAELAVGVLGGRR
jgi:hypothetical protein